MPVDPKTRDDRRVRRASSGCLQVADAIIAADVDQAGLAHLMVVLTAAVQALGLPAQGQAVGVTQLLDARAEQAGELDRIAGQAVADAGAEGLAGQLPVLRDRLGRILDAPLPQQVGAAAGPAEPATVLEELTIECCAIGLAAGATVPRAGLIAASRSLAGVLGERFGGRTIEMRIPPATAVQLEAFGQGPHHHRGTPPNVAETDPRTFVQLATGLLSWQDARAAGRIQASGSHVDAMAQMLPVVDLS